jgi:hypothetical protein
LLGRLQLRGEIDRHLLLAGGELSDQLVESFANRSDSKRHCRELFLLSAIKRGWPDRIGRACASAVSGARPAKPRVRVGEDSSRRATVGLSCHDRSNSKAKCDQEPHRRFPSSGGLPQQAIRVTGTRREESGRTTRIGKVEARHELHDILGQCSHMR